MDPKLSDISERSLDWGPYLTQAASLTHYGLAGLPLDARLFPVETSAPEIPFTRTALPPLLRPGAGLALMDISEFYGDTTGGVRTYLLQKARYFEARDHLRQSLLVPGAEDGIRQSAGVRCYRLRGPRIPTRQQYRLLFASRSVNRIFDHEQPHLVEIGSAWTAPWLARRALRNRAIPAVWFYHDHLPRVLTSAAGRDPTRAGLWSDLAWRYARMVSGFCRATLVATGTVAKELEEHGVHRVARVSLGVDLDLFHPARRHASKVVRRAYGLPEGPLALFAGRFAPEKQLDVLLDAWQVVERRTGAKLALVGDGPLRHRLQARPDAGRVYWLPHESDRSRLADLLASVDLVVTPSPTETFGLAALEAMASSTAVLAADQGGVAELVTRSRGGMLFPSGDRAGLAEVAINLLQGNPAALGVRGRAYAEGHHGWDRAFDRIVAVYRQVLASS